VQTYADGGKAPADTVWQVQGHAPDGSGGEDAMTGKIEGLDVAKGFRDVPPLSPDGAAPAPTAFHAPGYPAFRSLFQNTLAGMLGQDKLAMVRWAQVLLGGLTAALYFAAVRRGFHSVFLGLVAGLLCAAHPFWIINTGELADGTLSSFLLAAALALGVRAGQQGGALTCFLFGLMLAALGLTRPALLPFGLAAVLWFFGRSRVLKGGWLGAILALLGLVAGLAPWGVRNWSDLQTVVPVVDSAGWHLWVGNNPQAIGGHFTKEMLDTLPEARRKQLEGMPEGERYAALCQDAWAEVQAQPGDACKRRIRAGMYFLFGGATLEGRGVLDHTAAATLEPWVEPALYGTLLGMVLLGLIGWRWGYGWKMAAAPLALALFWGPLPYLIGHADSWHGPRLPLDGPLLCLAAVGLVGLIPGLGGGVRAGEDELPPDEVPGAGP
jgi:hypothetical protein